jgi:hypothetical protein
LAIAPMLSRAPFARFIEIAFLHESPADIDEAVRILGSASLARVNAATAPSSPLKKEANPVVVPIVPSQDSTRRWWAFAGSAGPPTPTRCFRPA